METIRRMSTHLVLVILIFVLIGCGDSEVSDVEVPADSQGEVVDMEDDSVDDDVEDVDESVDVSFWHTYQAEDFTIKYPQGWEPNQYNTFFDFRPSDSSQGGFVWSINQVPNRGETAENMITGMGSQYGKDRDIARFEVTVDGKEYLRVVVTTSRDPEFYYEGVFVETEEKVYFIANTDVESADFTAFYESFTFN